jgi:hypothetical protein
MFGEVTVWCMFAFITQSSHLQRCALPAEPDVGLWVFKKRSFCVYERRRSCRQPVRLEPPSENPIWNSTFKYLLLSWLSVHYDEL